MEISLIVTGYQQILIILIATLGHSQLSIRRICLSLNAIHSPQKLVVLQ
jgi:hypothetical protein